MVRENAARVDAVLPSKCSAAAVIAIKSKGSAAAAPDAAKAVRLTSAGNSLRDNTPFRFWTNGGVGKVVWHFVMLSVN